MGGAKGVVFGVLGLAPLCPDDWLHKVFRAIFSLSDPYSRLTNSCLFVDPIIAHHIQYETAQNGIRKEERGNKIRRNRGGDGGGVDKEEDEDAIRRGVK